MTDFYVEKRDGEKVKYNPKKIEDAITKANESLDSTKNGKITKTLIKTITNDVDETVMQYFKSVESERDALLTKINKRLSQLEKINEEELTDDQKAERKQLYEDQKNISEKLIYINITLNTGKHTDSENIAQSSLESFSEEEKAYYDIQYIVNKVMEEHLISMEY